VPGLPNRYRTPASASMFRKAWTPLTGIRGGVVLRWGVSEGLARWFRASPVYAKRDPTACYFFEELMRLAGRGAETVLGRRAAEGPAASSAGAGSASRVVTFMLPGTICSRGASPVLVISISGAGSSALAGAAAYWRPGQPPF